MPSVKPNEKQSDYISRCVSYCMDKEGLDQKAAVGKCYGLWKQHLKNKKAKGEIMTDEESQQLKEIEEEEFKDIMEKI